MMDKDIKVDYIHQIGKLKVNNDWNYMGEGTPKEKSNIGVFSFSDDRGNLFRFHERCNSFNGEGMSIIRDDSINTCYLGYTTQTGMGPHMCFSNRSNIITFYESDNKGFSIQVRSNGNFYIKQFIDGKTYLPRGMAFEHDSLYFEDLRKTDNRLSYAYRIGTEHKFHFHYIHVPDYFYKHSFIPSKVKKHDAKHFTFSGAHQTSNENETKYTYEYSTKSIKFNESGNGWAITYYNDNSYFFGYHSFSLGRDEIGCYKKGNYEAMGKWDNDVLYGPAVVKDKNSIYFCSNNEDRIIGTYFEMCDDYLLIRNGGYGDEEKYAYKVYANTFDLEYIELKTGKVIWKKEYNMDVSLDESPLDLEDMVSDGAYLNELDLADFNYVKESNGYIITSPKYEISSTTIPNCVTSLAPKSFMDETKCKYLNKVVVGKGLVNIGEDSFNNIESLNSVVFDKNNSLKKIGKRAFKNVSISKIDIPNSVTSIESEAFAGCKKLASVIVPDNCVVAKDAFPKWCEVYKKSEWDNGLKKRVKKNTSKFWNAIYSIGDFFKGKKKKRLPKDNVKQSKQVKKTSTKKAASFHEKTFMDVILNILRIICLPFIYIGKGFMWLAKKIGKWFGFAFRKIKKFFVNLDISKEQVFMALPLVLLIGYTITSFIVGANTLMELDTSKLMYDGYDWNVSGACANWLENTDHNFFTAITLGLFQIICIVLGFVVDLLAYVFILVFGLLFMFLGEILRFIVTEVMPIAIIIGYIVMMIFSSKSSKKFIGICMGLTLLCAIAYYASIFMTLQ